LNSAVNWSNVSLLNAMSLLLAAKAASSQRADTQFNLQTLRDSVIDPPGRRSTGFTPTKMTLQTPIIRGFAA
jgi:hypothetical protein